MSKNKALVNAVTALGITMTGVPFLLVGLTRPDQTWLFLAGLGLPVVFGAFLFLYIKVSNTSRTNELEQIASQFGNPVAPVAPELDDTPTARFERDGTIFTVRTYQSKQFFTPVVEFNLPALNEKFIIRDDFYLFRKSDFAELQPAMLPGLKRPMLLFSPNPEFLGKLLNEQNVRAEIEKYPAGSFWNPSHLKIAFADGRFEIEWYCGTGMTNEQALGKVIDTAVAFRNKLRKLNG